MILNNAVNEALSFIMDSTTFSKNGIVLYSGYRPTNFKLQYATSINVVGTHPLPFLMKQIANVTANNVKYLLGTSNTTTYSNVPNVGVIFGTGTTPPTDDDFTLSGDIIYDLSSSNVTASQSITAEDDTFVVATTYTINNTGTEDITIGEVGLLENAYCYDTGHTSSYSYRGFLVERTVLDSPITIPAGGFGQVVYTMRINTALTE